MDQFLSQFDLSSFLMGLVFGMAVNWIVGLTRTSVIRSDTQKVDLTQDEIDLLAYYRSLRLSSKNLVFNTAQELYQAGQPFLDIDLPE